MKQSIESIWQQGFLDENALIAPVINNLYNKKSKNIVDKFKRILNINVYFLMAFSLFMLLVLVFKGATYFGVLNCVLFMLFAFLGKRQLKELEAIDNNMSSYQYIKSFDVWLKKIFANMTKMSTYFYPLYFIAFVRHLQFSVGGQLVIDGFISDFPDSFLFLGVPWFLVVGVLIISGFLAYFSGLLFRVEINTFYGRVIKKLDEIIADMEELRK